MPPKSKKPSGVPSAAASKVAAAPKKASGSKLPANPLYEKRPRSFGIGQALPPPNRDLHRFVKWPRYVRIQRQRRVLNLRLKVPPTVNQFRRTLDKSVTGALFKLLNKYRPEDKGEKKERLQAQAEAAAAGADDDSKRPLVVKYGINHIAYLVEQNKAQLVVIASDVDPLELVIWLPALCRKMGVPYCIVKCKARLGAVVHKKTATALCLTGVKPEDKMDLGKIVESCKLNFNDNGASINRTWGGGIMGPKSQMKTKLRNKAIAREAGAKK